MLADTDKNKVSAFCKHVEELRLGVGALHRSFNALHAEATSLTALLTGPAVDAHAVVSDGQTHLGDCEAKLRELEISVANLLAAGELSKALAERGWSFDGWAPEEGWVARRGGEDDVAAAVTVTDRRPTGLLTKVVLRDREDGRHG